MLASAIDSAAPLALPDSSIEPMGDYTSQERSSPVHA
jgi:hypothetical protein